MSDKDGRSALERFLRLFASVKSGEGLTVVLLALNVFIILTAYYVLKPVREALILGQGSAELKSYISAGSIAILALAVPAYGFLSSRLPRRRLINSVTAFFVVCLVLFYALAQFDVPLGIVFFIWVGIFNLMIVAQFWSFANDIYTNEEGERLFPIVAFGASAGAVLGSVIAGRLIQPFGVYQLMLVGAALLILAVVISNAIDSRERGRSEIALDKRKFAEPVEGEEKTAEPDLVSDIDSGHGAFALVFRCRYLLMIAVFVLFVNWVNTTGEYILGSVVKSAAERAVALGQAGGLTVEQSIGKFYSDFFGVVNLAGLLIQLFLVSRIIKYLGIRVAIFILPIIALGAYAILAFYPVLQVVRWGKTAENSTDYSLNNTVRHTLFLPCTREQKYKAGQVVDSFFWRAGDVLSALLVFVGINAFAWSASGFAKFNILLVSLWLVLVFFIGREYSKLVKSGRPPCVGSEREPAETETPERELVGA